jgi:hypothetical protein
MSSYLESLFTFGICVACSSVKKNAGPSQPNISSNRDCELKYQKETLGHFESGQKKEIGNSVWGFFFFLS